MRTQLLSVCLVLCAAPMVLAQQWPGYAANPNAQIPMNTMSPMPPPGIYSYPQGPIAAPEGYGYPPVAWPLSGVAVDGMPNGTPRGGAGTPYINPPPSDLGGKASVDAANKAMSDAGDSVSSASKRMLVPGMPVGIDEETLEKSARRDEDEPNYFHRKTNEKWWISGGYMESWFKSERPAGPLVTTGSVSDAHPGAVGQPNTVSLFGANDTNYGMFQGVRAEVGFFLDDSDTYSIDISGFYLNPNHVRASASSDGNGNPFLSRPVLNAISMQEISFIDASPGMASGGFSVDSRSELFGSEINERVHVYGVKRLHLDALLGFRYTHLDESLTIQDQFQPLIANTFTFNNNFVGPGSSVVDQDRFQTSNDFYGMQLGGEVAWEENWFTLKAFFKFALGVNNEYVNINGSSSLYNSGVLAQTVQGGILAQQSNIGSSNHTLFGYMPETGASFSVTPTKHLEFTATYSFLYWNEVARPQGQIDRSVNPGLVPTDVSYSPTTQTVLRPNSNFTTEPFWVNSLTLGVTIHY